MNILIAPDKFKGSLSAIEVCKAIQTGLLQQNKNVKIHLHPMADGGDGSLEILSQHLTLKQRFVQVSDPLGREIETYYYTANKIAFIELAQASGLVLLDEKERNPLKATTLGTGQLIKHAIDWGYKEIYLFIGGSATNDGGMGIAAVLGTEFLDKDGRNLYPSGGNLAKVVTIRNNPFFYKKDVNITLLCDVTNPLYGTNGAAHVYARQKGADDAMIVELDQGMRQFSQLIHQQTGINIAELAGSGAAGGIAATLVPLYDAKIKSGIESLIELTHLEEQIQQADLVISGEGRLDTQSLQGKVVDGVASLCKKYQKPLMLFVGKNELSKQEQIQLDAVKIHSILEQTSNIDDAMKNGAAYLRNMAVDLILSN